MRVFLAVIFATIVMGISRMIPGFAFNGVYEHALFYVVVWLTGYELFEKYDK